jgi:hypothetical protein
MGGTAERLPEGGLLLNKNVSVKMYVMKGWAHPNLNTTWRLLLGKQLAADFVIIARIKAPAQSILDYFVIPACSQMRGVLTARETDNDAFLEIYRYDDLGKFIETFRRFSLQETA